VAYERNLVLVHTPKLQGREDFEAIRATLAERAPDIEVFIVLNNIPNSTTTRQAALRPTLIFSPVPLRSFAPRRGKVLAGQSLGKWAEIERMAAGGISVPRSVLLQPGMTFDPAEWGPYMVVKPRRGKQGRGVRLHRTRDVRWRDPRSFPLDDPRHGVDLIAQQFIDTGPHTQHFRVMTVLGRTGYSSTSRWSAPRDFALDPDGSDPVDHIIASNTGERTFALAYDKDVLAFGERIAGVFPDVPVLGIDIVREARSGRLYALEVNAGGATWHFSSDYGLDVQRRRNANFAGQFDALNVIADAMIETTRRLAE
jgi:hypothetical protein